MKSRVRFSFLPWGFFLEAKDSHGDHGLGSLRVVELRFMAHAVPLPCRVALVHTCHTAPLPFSDIAVSFMKVRVVAKNIRTANITV
jgi:hypothetical protein